MDYEYQTAGICHFWYGVVYGKCKIHVDFGIFDIDDGGKKN